MVTGVQVGPTGMVFQLDSHGVPQAQNWPDGGAVSETPFPAEWILTVTGVPAGTPQATVAAMITSAPVALPLPWKLLRWQVAYASLGSAVTATAW